MLRYFASLPTARIVLWCYLIWYFVNAYHCFDPTPAIWLNSLGISAIIGLALMLSVSGPVKPAANPWQTFRLFMMPLCVSSFSSLIKGRGYFLVFPPDPKVLLHGFGAIAAFLVFVFALKRWK